MSKKLVSGILAALLVSGAGLLTARAQDEPEKKDDKNEKKLDMKVLISTFMDPNAKLDERETALGQAASTGISKANPQRAVPLKKALADLLEQLVSKKTNPAYTNFILRAMKSLDVFTPFPDLGPLMKPYLSADVPDPVRAGAVQTIERHGAGGVSKELLAIIQEPIVGNPRTNHAREQLERGVVRCTYKMPGQDALVILKGTIATSKYRGVRLVATRALGDMCIDRGPKEYDEKIAKLILLECARESNTDEEVACAAALGLTHYGSYEGIAELMKRTEKDHRGGSKEVYKTLCQASHNPRGFLDVAPERWNELDSATRDNVRSAIKEWWGGAKDQKPEQALFDALKAAGITVPRDPDSKELVTALISGLELENRELRYAALDHLVRKTGRTEPAKHFKYLVSGKGDNVIHVNQPEPPDGFQDKARQDELLTQQREKAKEWRAWWEKASQVAVLKDGVWTGW